MEKNSPTSLVTNRRGRREVWRLVGMLIVILIAMKIASRPETWKWMFPDEAIEQPPDESNQLPTEVPEPEALIEAESSSTPPTATSSELDSSHPEAASQTGQQPNTSFGRHTTEDFEIATEILAAVRDDTLGVRHAEAEAFYQILSRASQLPREKMANSAHRDATFTALMTDPDYYRGKLVRIEGDVARLNELPSLPDRNDLSHLWEAWIFTQDSGSSPYRVVVTRIPDGIPQGEQLDERVRVRLTGFFFKREGYAAQSGLRSAPLLLAKELQWIKSPVSLHDRGWGGPWIVGLAVILGLYLLLSVRRFAAVGSSFRQRRFKPGSPAAVRAIETQHETETAQTRQMLEELETAEQWENAQESGDEDRPVG